MWTIRDAEPADYAQIRTMSDGIQRAERDAVGYPMLPPEDVGDDYIDAIIASGAGPEGEILLAELKGEPVGYLIGYKKIDKDEFVDEQFRHHAHIADLYVDPNARKLGIASEMIRLFTQRMKARGCDWMRVFGKAENKPAVKTYAASGFVPYEITFVKKI